MIRVASLVMGVSLLLSACASTESTGPTSTPSPTASGSPAPSAPPLPTGSPALETVPPVSTPFGINPPIQYLDPTTLFARAESELMRSDDAGKTWTSLGVPRFARFVELRMIDRARGWAVLFYRRDQPQIGCMQASTAAACHSAVAVTNDGGRTWVVRLTNPLSAGGGESIGHLQAVDAAHAWVLVDKPCDETVCDRELRATSDGGITWKMLRSGRVTQLRVASLARAWFGADAGDGSIVYGTADGGGTWTQQLATQQPLIALDAASERDAWVLTRDGGYCTSSSCQRYELLVTRDGGSSWSSLGNPKENVAARPPQSCTYGHLTGPLFASAQIGWLGLSPGNGGVAVTGGTMRTNDGGRTWTCSVAPHDAERLSAADPDHVLALSRDSQTAAYALWRSTDSGRTWTPIVPR